MKNHSLDSVHVIRYCASLDAHALKKRQSDNNWLALSVVDQFVLRRETTRCMYVDVHPTKSLDSTTKTSDLSSVCRRLGIALIEFP